MNYKAGKGRLIVKVDPHVTESEGGVIMSKAAPALTGTVVSVGEPHVDDDGTVHHFSVKEGDRVMYTRYAGNCIHDDLWVMQEGFILGVLDE